MLVPLFELARARRLTACLGLLEHCAGRCCGREGWWRESQIRDGGMLLLSRFC
jgi:hypothetical protein